MRDHNIKYWCETSAKSGQNIEGLFLNATKFLYNQMNEPDGATETSESDIGGDNSKSSNSHMGSIPQIMLRVVPMRPKDTSNNNVDAIRGFSLQMSDGTSYCLELSN